MKHLSGLNIFIPDGRVTTVGRVTTDGRVTDGIWIPACRAILEEEHYSIQIDCQTCEEAEQYIHDYLWTQHGYSATTNVTFGKIRWLKVLWDEGVCYIAVNGLHLSL